METRLAVVKLEEETAVHAMGASGPSVESAETKQRFINVRILAHFTI